MNANNNSTLPYSDQDVISGRGPLTNQHPGNVNFRKWIARFHIDYKEAVTNQQKREIKTKVLNNVLNQTPKPGNFL